METHRILVPASSPSIDVGDRYALELEALAGMDVVFEECSKLEEGFVGVAQGASAVYIRGIKMTAPMIEALDRCRAIVLGSVGVEYVDLAAASAKGIPVTNCPDTFTEEVADHTMMLLLATHRRVMEQDQLVRAGRWSEGRGRLLKIPRLRGLTLGFLGFGRVARAVAERAKAFGLRTVAYDPFVDEQVMVMRGVDPVSLSELLSASDFVSLHLPETAATRGLLGETQFRTMKPGAIVINTGRGSTIVEQDLANALKRGWIAGAGLDVLEVEPPSIQSPLLRMSNVVLSPHNASASTRFDPARKRRVGQELALVLSGRWPLSCVNPEVLATSDLRQWRATSS